MPKQTWSGTSKSTFSGKAVWSHEGDSKQSAVFAEEAINPVSSHCCVYILSIADFCTEAFRGSTGSQFKPTACRRECGGSQSTPFSPAARMFRQRKKKSVSMQD